MHEGQPGQRGKLDAIKGYFTGRLQRNSAYPEEIALQQPAPIEQTENFTDRLHHPADFLTLPIEIEEQLFKSELNTLLCVKDAIAGDGAKNKGVNRNLLLIMDDEAFFEYAEDEQGEEYISGIRVDVVGSGYSFAAHKRNKKAVVDSLEKTLQEDTFKKTRVFEANRRFTDLVEIDDRHTVVTINGDTDGDLPMHLHIQTLPGINFGDYVSGLTNEEKEFSAYWTTKDSFTKEDYYERLPNLEAEAVGQIASLINVNLGITLGGRVAMIAEGSTTEETPDIDHCQDIDLRVVYENGSFGNTTEDIVYSLNKAMRARRLGARRDDSIHAHPNGELITEETEQPKEIRKRILDETTGEEIVLPTPANEPSFMIGIKGSSRKIHLTISGEPIKRLEDAISKEDRPDRPVILEITTNYY